MAVARSKRLSRQFFARTAPVVASELLGCRLLTPDGISLRITETEAYTAEDPASHSFHGETKRNAVMFGPPGHLYVYFTYGMHWCANVTTGPVGVGEAVLFRAGVVEAGNDLVRSRRPVQTKAENMTNGPAKLCQALAIASDQNGIDLCTDTGFSLLPALLRPDVVITPRIGISQGVDTLWRFLAIEPDADV
jgi:DNA-3-methyladenine glycosylase